MNRVCVVQSSRRRRVRGRRRLVGSVGTEFAAGRSYRTRDNNQAEDGGEVEDLPGEDRRD